MLTKSLAEEAVPCDSRACRDFSCARVRKQFLKLLGVLRVTFRVDLSTPSFLLSPFSLAEIKRFCGNPLDPTFGWSVPRASASEIRAGVLHSIFLFARPSLSPVPDVDSYARKMSVSSDIPEQGFLDFVDEEIDRMFPLGWDKRYTNQSLSVVPPLSSCLESGRKKAGARGLTTRGGWFDHAEYVEAVLSREKPSLVPELRRPGGCSKLSVVETAGKKRIISVPTIDMNLLKPLHTVMYDHISQSSWCLRGNATPRSFRDFTSVEGEVFVSGDYESATDNLNSHVQRRILSRLLVGTRKVPDAIVSLALSSLNMGVRATFTGSSFSFVQQRGQMMGNLLSFPLLSIVNYLTFRYFVRRDVPVRINGDDIVFRCTPKEAEVWKQGVGRGGLVLSEGKTTVSPSFFSLNSLLFRARRSKVRLCRQVRSTSLFGCGNVEKSVYGFSGRFRDFCPGFTGSSRTRARVAFLSLNYHWLCLTRKSLLRLGLRLCPSVVKASGLWLRELFYLSLDESPLPSLPSDWSSQVYPPNWLRVRVPARTEEYRRLERERSSEVRCLQWVSPLAELPPPSDSEALEPLSVVPLFKFPDLRRRARLLGVCVQNVRRSLVREIPVVLLRDFLSGFVSVWERPSASIRGVPLPPLEVVTSSPACGGLEGCGLASDPSGSPSSFAPPSDLTRGCRVLSRPSVSPLALFP